MIGPIALLIGVGTTLLFVAASQFHGAKQPLPAHQFVSVLGVLTIVSIALVLLTVCSVAPIAFALVAGILLPIGIVAR